MYTKLFEHMTKPTLYEPSPNKFWDDEHISKAILNAHLNPNHDNASRKPKFMDKSAYWISKVAPPAQYNLLLDLGCGPGLYAERFKKLGYLVTGIDFSRRSIAYAKRQSETNNSNIEYLYKNYLTIDYYEKFDIVTLIWCDYGELSPNDRYSLLNKIHKSLKPNGKFIFDVFSTLHYQNKSETHDWKYYEKGGFWDKEPHIYLNSFHRYDNDNTVLDQAIIINQEGLKCYNIWNHGFTKETLMSEIQAAGFTNYKLFDNISGKRLSSKSTTICAVLTK